MKYTKRTFKKINNIEKPKLLDYLLIILFRILENTQHLKNNSEKQKQIILSILKKLQKQNIFPKSLNKQKLENLIIQSQNKFYIFQNEKHKLFHFLKNNHKTTKMVQTNIKINRNKNSNYINDKLSGGFYFKSLESKGDNPITGNDLAKLLDEVQQFFYNAKYTEEGEWLREPDTLISLFRGDTDAFRFYLSYYILPKYYQTYPPFLKFGAIKDAIFNRKKLEDYPDYLLAYLNYMKSKNEWEVSQGLAKPINYDATPFAKFANSSDQLMQKVAQYRRKILQPQSKLLILGSPASGGISVV